MLSYEEMKKQKSLVLVVCAVVVLGTAISLLLKTSIEQKNIGDLKDIVSPSPVTTSPENIWKTYTSNSFSFRYPSDILFAPTGQSDDSVFITRPANIDSPMALPDEGIWIEATVYPATAKAGLIKEVTSLMTASVGTVTVHPITPYPETFIKEKNINYNGVFLVSTSMDSGEMASALWVKNNTVYQLRIAVAKRSVFENFKPTFQKIIDTFTIID